MNLERWLTWALAVFDVVIWGHNFRAIGEGLTWMAQGLVR